MRRFEFPGHWANFTVTLAYSLVPGLLLLWAAVFCYWSRWTAPWTTLLMAVLATISPLAIVALGWDLSRFLELVDSGRGDRLDRGRLSDARCHGVR